MKKSSKAIIVEGYLNDFSDLPYNQKILAEIINGIYSGYPICCVLNYLKLIVKGKKPWEEMEKKCSYKSIKYVPCNACCKNKRFLSSRKLNKGLVDMGVIEEFYSLFE